MILNIQYFSNKMNVINVQLQEEKLGKTLILQNMNRELYKYSDKFQRKKQVFQMKKMSGK